MPKNCDGDNPVSARVAKNAPTTGRVVAIPSAIASARTIHSR
jgi:hypothetical protein